MVFATVNYLSRQVVVSNNPTMFMVQGLNEELTDDSNNPRLTYRLGNQIVLSLDSSSKKMTLTNTWSFTGNGSGLTNLGTAGIANLHAGTNKVSTSAFNTNRLPYLTYLSTNGTVANACLQPAGWSQGSYFTIYSSNSNDSNQVQWLIVP
jgi:hypothetical protein